MIKYYKFSCLLTLLILTKSFSQDSNLYSVDVRVLHEEKILTIKQKMRFQNQNNFNLEKIVLEDWANSYKTNKTALAKRISDEYSRTFTFAKNKQRGYTKILSVESNNISSWQKDETNADIILLNLKTPLKKNDFIDVFIDYEIKLPDSKFTGFGYDENNLYLKNWLIVFSTITQDKWSSQNNLNLDDQSIKKSIFNIDISFDKNFYLSSNLFKSETKIDGDIKTVTLFNDNLRDVKINILDEKIFNEFQNSNFFIETDIFKQSSIVESNLKFNRVSKFISEYFNLKNKLPMLVQKVDYDSKPFYALNQLPSFISPFSDKFLEEIIFLKSFITNFLENKMNLNKRENHWIYNGLEIFLIDKYITQYYPKVKFLGNLSTYKFLKNYKISELGFNELFINYTEYVQRLNLHQSDNNSTENFTRINEEIVVPYHSGVGLKFIEYVMGEDKFKNLINQIENITSQKELKNIFYDNKSIDLKWFINDYVGSRQSIDLFAEKINNTSFRVSEKNDIRIPYNIGLVKDDNIIYTKYFNYYGQIDIPEIDYDYFVVNPKISLPEINRKNNWIDVRSNNGLKPFKLKLLADIEDPKYRELYFRPEFTYNFYDGISPGITLLNKGFKNKPFTYEILSQYASKEKNLIGSINLRYQINNESSDNYTRIFNLFYQSNHYNVNKRYHLIVPYVQFNYRDSKNLRSNKRKTARLSYYNVIKDKSDINSFNNYGILKFDFLSSNIGIINYNKSNLNTQISKNFGNLSLTYEFRRLLDNNRQFQIRFFFGKFLWNNVKDNTYFNYNLSRSPDYLFTSNYLGRSEKEGLLSQQLVISGGGFKSFFNNGDSNNLIISSNINIGIWKWFEAYTDIGLIKNYDESSDFFYGSGIRLNILPDFFELYFPIHTSNGFEVNHNKYNTKIRFIVSYNIESLGKLFSRRWL
tara:strand:+ start:11579 stop:14356 length:2778 start_codon:yes stop_codon:yes gene_type:complete